MDEPLLLPKLEAGAIGTVASMRERDATRAIKAVETIARHWNTPATFANRLP